MAENVAKFGFWSTCALAPWRPAVHAAVGVCLYADALKLSGCPTLSSELLPCSPLPGNASSAGGQYTFHTYIQESFLLYVFTCSELCFYIFMTLNKLVLLSMLQLDRTTILSDLRKSKPACVPPRPAGESWPPLPGRCFPPACVAWSCVVLHYRGPAPASELETDTSPPVPQCESAVQSAPIAPWATILSAWMGRQYRAKAAWLIPGMFIFTVYGNWRNNHQLCDSFDNSVF